MRFVPLPRDSLVNHQREWRDFLRNDAALSHTQFSVSACNKQATSRGWWLIMRFYWRHTSTVTIPTRGQLGSKQMPTVTPTRTLIPTVSAIPQKTMGFRLSSTNGLYSYCLGKSPLAPPYKQSLMTTHHFARCQWIPLSAKHC